jgi:hypothetical protein
MRLLISDANILIDMASGALMDKLFALPMQFGIFTVLCAAPRAINLCKATNPTRLGANGCINGCAS